MSRLAVTAAGLLLVFAFGTWMAWSYVTDAAFVDARYARNLAEGHGLVYNVGDHNPVEGFTSLLWTLWQSLFSLFGADPVLVAQITGVAAGVATLVLLMRAVDGAAAVVAGCAYVLFLPTYFHLAGGLETGLVALVVLRMAVLGMRVVEERHVVDLEPPLLLVLAATLRPEALIAVLPGFVVWFRSRRFSGQARAGLTAAAVLGVGCIVWTVVQYGHLVPKPWSDAVGPLGFDGEWLWSTVVVLAPLLLLTVALLTWPELRRVGAFFCVTVLAAGLPLVVFGPPEADALHRYAFTVFPVLCLAAGVAVAAMAGVRFVQAGVGVVVVGWVAVAGVASPGLPAVANTGTDLARTHAAIGRGLADADVPAGARTVAVADPGVIPYYSGWNAVDYSGRNNGLIADGARPDSVVRTHDPAVIVVPSPGQNIPEKVHGLDVPIAVAGYSQLGPFQARSGSWQFVFVKPEFAQQVEVKVRAAVARGEQQYGDDYSVTINRWLNSLKD
ncbi:hypothetical protein [Prauserella aidingensis]|uniref:hypothetical protein n=1 Tax=Prauserella aidingensis TaxID=387890 RepID=UPI0020A58601|nr:hypothetical protein [Prauserella aidingensis]